MASNGNLVASHPGNTSAAKHGLYSGRLLAERAREVRDSLLTLQHVHPLDVFAAEELGSLIAALEAIDKGLDARPKAASRRMLLEHKNRLSKTLLSYLREIGATPRARWESVTG